MFFLSLSLSLFLIVNVLLIPSPLFNTSDAFPAKPRDCAELTTSCCHGDDFHGFIKASRVSEERAEFRGNGPLLCRSTSEAKLEDFETKLLIRSDVQHHLHSADQRHSNEVVTPVFRCRGDT